MRLMVWGVKVHTIPASREPNVHHDALLAGVLREICRLSTPCRRRLQTSVCQHRVLFQLRRRPKVRIADSHSETGLECSDLGVTLRTKVIHCLATARNAVAKRITFGLDGFEGPVSGAEEERCGPVLKETRSVRRSISISGVHVQLEKSSVGVQLVHVAVEGMSKLVRSMVTLKALPPTTWWR